MKKFKKILVCIKVNFYRCMIHFLSRFNSHNYMYYPVSIWNSERIILYYVVVFIHYFIQV